MAKNEPQPLWLQKDGRRHLYAGPDVADAKANGWAEPTGVRANGAEWNPPAEEDEQSQAEAAVEVGKAINERDAKRSEKKAKQEAEAQRAAEAARADAPVSADFTVEVVEPSKKKAKR